MSVNKSGLVAVSDPPRGGCRQCRQEGFSLARGGSRTCWALRVLRSWRQSISDLTQGLDRKAKGACAFRGLVMTSALALFGNVQRAV